MDFKSKIKTRYSIYLTRYFALSEAKLVLLNYLFAEKNHGTFVFRINNTFNETADAIEMFTDTLHWLGVAFELVLFKDKTDYKDKIIDLIEKGLAYPDQYAAENKGKNRCVNVSESMKMFLEKKYQMRFKLPESKISFMDSEVGRLTWKTKDIKDPVICDSSNKPTAFFMDTIEDGEENITHVIKNQLNVYTTPTEIAILQALGYNIPVFSHVEDLQMDYVSNDIRNDLLRKLSVNLYTSNYLEYYQNLGFFPQTLIEILTRKTKCNLSDFFEINKKHLHKLSFNEHKVKCKNIIQNKVDMTDEQLSAILSSYLYKMEVHADVLKDDFLNCEKSDQESIEKLKLLVVLLDDLPLWTEGDIEITLNKIYSDALKKTLNEIINNNDSWKFPNLSRALYFEGRNQCLLKIKEFLNKSKKQLFVIRSKGKFWYNEKGLLHRLDGPAIAYFDGDEEWFFEGKRHREGGPAITTKNLKEWWYSGKCHREDGPAVIRSDGVKVWFLNGIEYTEERHLEKCEHVLSLLE